MVDRLHTHPAEEDPDGALSLDEKFIMAVGAFLFAVLILVVGYVVVGGYIANQVFANVAPTI